MDESTPAKPDQFRIVHDGTTSGPNLHIMHHIGVRGQCPRTHDLAHAVSVDRGLNATVHIGMCVIDAKMAHKRIKVMRKDWRYQAARFQAPSGRWKCVMNLTGTYGMGSAQFWWGILMPLIQRIAMHMGLARWALLHVDDLLAMFCFLDPQ